MRLRKARSYHCLINEITLHNATEMLIFQSNFFASEFISVGLFSSISFYTEIILSKCKLYIKWEWDWGLRLFFGGKWKFRHASHESFLLAQSRGNKLSLIFFQNLNSHHLQTYPLSSSSFYNYYDNWSLMLSASFPVKCFYELE